MSKLLIVLQTNSQVSVYGTNQVLWYFMSESFFSFTNSVDPNEILHLICGILSGSTLFVNVPILGFPLYKELKDVNHCLDQWHP